MTREKRLRLEREVLRALCGGARDASVRAKGLALLRDHRMSWPEHDAILDALRAIGSARGERLRQDLLALLTRRGFPDVDLDALFVCSEWTAREALEKMRQLLAEHPV